MNASTTKIIERDGWKVTLDTSEPIVRAGLLLDFDWIGVALELVEPLVQDGMPVIDALETVNAGHSWAVIERSES